MIGSDLVWPILRLLGWSEFLTHQNLSAGGRADLPVGLLFSDAEAKAQANPMAAELAKVPR